jgi:hypothetical protein
MHASVGRYDPRTKMMILSWWAAALPTGQWSLPQCREPCMNDEWMMVEI